MIDISYRVLICEHEQDRMYTGQGSLMSTVILVNVHITFLVHMQLLVPIKYNHYLIVMYNTCSIVCLCSLRVSSHCFVGTVMSVTELGLNVGRRREPCMNLESTLLYAVLPCLCRVKKIKEQYTQTNCSLLLTTA